MAHGQRLGSVDFWRGLVLCVIMVDHVPGDLLESVTPRNFGFSDSAEAFVFLSGLSVGLAYYRYVLRDDRLGAMRRCLARAVRIYGVHLGLTLGAIAVFAIGYAASSLPNLIEGDGRDYIFNHNPRRGILGVFMLSQQLGYFNILPLYVALMLWSPLVLIMARIHKALALGVAVAIYAGARLWGLALPNWPEPGTWFLNPFAWQLLFTIGILSGICWRDRRPRYLSPLFAAATVGIAAAAVFVTGSAGLAPGLHDWAFGHLDLLKQNLGLVRLAHFLLIAYLISQVPFLALLARTRAGQELQRVGRHSLAVFAVGSLFSAVGQVLMRLADARFSDGVESIGLVYAGFGVAGLFLLARYLEWTKASSLRQPDAVRTSSGVVLPDSAFSALSLPPHMPASPQ
jgi:hypothetical protein